MLAVPDRHGLAPLGGEGRQVLLGEPAPRLRHGAGDRLRDRPPVEGLAAALRDLAQRRRELLVGHDGARARAAVAEVEALRLRRAPERGACGLEEVHVLERQRHAALGELDRGAEHPGAVHRAEALERCQPAAEVARRRARLRAARELVVGAPPGVGRLWRGADEVEHVPLSAARDQHETDPARARHEGLDDVQRRTHGDGRVHGVAAGEQHADPGHGGERVGGGHDAAGSHDGRAVGVPVWRHQAAPCLSVARPRAFGSSASRRPSPTRLRARIVSRIAAPG